MKARLQLILISISFLSLFPKGLTGNVTPGNLRYLPAVVIDFKQGSNPTTNAKVTEALSIAMQRAVLSAIAEQVYGADQSAGRVQGPLSLVGRTLLSLDEIISESGSEWEDMYRSIPDYDSISFSVQLRWVPSTKSVSNISYPLALNPTTLSWLIRIHQSGLMNFLKEESQNTSQTLVMDKKLLPKGSALTGLDNAVYLWLSDGNQKQWLPLRLDLDFTLTNRGLTFQFKAFIKPGISFMPVTQTFGPFAVQGLSYQPAFFHPTTPGLMMVKLDRYYQRNAPLREPLNVRLKFGFLSGDMFISWPRSQTTDSIHKVPTIGLAVSSKTDELTRAVLSGVSHVYLPIQELTINLDDPEGPRVITQASRIPIVLQLVDFIGNRYLANILDEQTEIGGFNLYQRLVDTRVTSKITNSMRQTIKQMDQHANKTLGNTLTMFGDLFKYQ